MILYFAFASAMHLSRALPENASHFARATLYSELVDSARTSPRTPEVLCGPCPSLRHVARIAGLAHAHIALQLVGRIGLGNGSLRLSPGGEDCARYGDTGASDQYACECVKHDFLRCR